LILHEWTRSAKRDRKLSRRVSEADVTEDPLAMFEMDNFQSPQVSFMPGSAEHWMIWQVTDESFIDIQLSSHYRLVSMLSY
jgi:hypothetical protein